MVHIQMFGFQALSEIRIFCVCPKNLECLKSEQAFVHIFGTVWNPNVQISNIHFTVSEIRANECLYYSVKLEGGSQLPNLSLFTVVMLELLYEK